VEFPSSGGAGLEVRGISVDSLLKLREFRGGEASALHCIALHLCPHHPELLRQLRRELQALLEPGDEPDACIIDGGISDLRDSAGRFQSEIDLVQGEMDRFADSYRLEGELGQSEVTGPLAVLQRLLEDSRELASKLDEEIEVALGTARCLLEYFGERQPQGGWANEVCLAVEKFFATIKEFVVSFEDAWRDVLENPRKLRLEGLELIGQLSSSPRASVSGGSSSDSNPTRAIGQSGKTASSQSSSCTNTETTKRASDKEGASAGVTPPSSDSALQNCKGEDQRGKSITRSEMPVKKTSLAAEAAAFVRRRKSSGMRLSGLDFGPSRLLPVWPPIPVASSTCTTTHLPL
jgi:hypothetical protein